MLRSSNKHALTDFSSNYFFTWSTSSKVSYSIFSVVSIVGIIEGLPSELITVWTRDSGVSGALGS